MTNQEAFDKMMEHLRSLKGRSLDKNGDACVYNGSMCAIGALMTDEEQEEFGDFKGNVFEITDYMLMVGHKSILCELDEYLLFRMQTLHDSPFNWDAEGFKAEDKAEEIANKYNLTYTESRQTDD